MKPTSTRFIGWCPVCQRDIKVRIGRLVHHGYLRPGFGYIVGDCPGVGQEPYETGTGACTHYLNRYVVPTIRDTKHTLAVLNRPEGPPYLAFQDYDGRNWKRDPRSGAPIMVRLTRDEADARAAQLPPYYDWDRTLRIAIDQTESKLEHWQDEKVRTDQLIADWQPKPLRTSEEEITHQEQKKAEREAAKAAARDQKIAGEVSKFQKRIDSAVRNKNSAVLADIYASHKIIEVSGYRMTDAEALELLDRDDVWRAFGLLTDEGYLIKEAQDILHDMTRGKWVARPDRGYDILPFPWPDALGGGIAKTR